MKKYLAAAGIASVIGAAGLSTAGIVSATTPSTSGPMAGIVDALANKFNLDKAEVQSVFDEQRTQMRAQREADVKTEITQLVSEGKLTQEQADKLNAKRAELKKEREADRETHQNMTPEERRAEMEKHRAELEAWAEENGIDTTYLRYIMGGDRGHGGGGMRMMRDGS